MNKLIEKPIPQSIIVDSIEDLDDDFFPLEDILQAGNYSVCIDTAGFRCKPHTTFAVTDLYYIAPDAATWGTLREASLTIAQSTLNKAVSHKDGNTVLKDAAAIKLRTSMLWELINEQVNVAACKVYELVWSKDAPHRGILYDHCFVFIDAAQGRGLYFSMDASD